MVKINLKLSEEMEKEYKGFFEYWTEIEELINFRECDVIIDEIATYFDSTRWKELSPDIKRWLQLHRHYGIEIYGNTQTFSTIDISFRRLTDELYLLKKLLGSREPSNTRPPIKRIWGVILIRTLDARNYKEEEQENRAYGFSLLFYSKADTEIYDTKQELKVSSYPPLKHIERYCEICGKTHIVHH